MPATKKSRNWSEIKSVLSSKDKPELLSALADLYKLSEGNREFLHTRFAPSTSSLDSYKKIIQSSMYPDVRKNKPIQIAKGKKAITDYAKASGDKLGELDLMIYFVEMGNQFTVDIGDLYSAFYDSLLSVYEKAVERVKKLAPDQASDFKERLRKVMESGSGIGWGYADGLSDAYYTAWPDEEE